MSRRYWDEYADWLRVSTLFEFPDWPSMARGPYWYKRERVKERKMQRNRIKP